MNLNESSTNASSNKLHSDPLYRKIPIMGFYLFKRLSCWAYFRGSLFSEELIIGRNFAFQNGLGFTIKSFNPNSPWAYIWEGLLSEGYLRLRFGGLIFGRAYISGVLLSEFYGIKFRTLNSLTIFPGCLRRILGISWQDKVPNSDVLSRAGLPSIFTLLRQRRLRWLGHVHRMPDGRIPKDLLYGELAYGKRSIGRPQLRYRDVVKRDMKTVDINTESWESLAANRFKWREALTKHLKSGEEKLTQAATERRIRRKQSDSLDRPETEHRCSLCNKDCHSRIGLFSHRPRCSSQTDD